MALTVGSRLGHYDVTALIGEGGMGQVYRATDTKLNRQVALKILPEAFAEDPDRLGRFQREAQVLASLNHPGIAAIYGIEEADDTRALVLELVEGPTLADRIKQGPIPVDEALPIAKQIAEALEAAHEAGVIHRDLKPANVKVKDDGTVKVLDFGLAKALDTTPEGDPSQSPTLTAAATQMGVIMGTAAYMSPEQARGKPVDKRADIWAFGAVLFEMLSGRRAFAANEVSDTLVSVLRDDPDWSALRDDVPPRVRQAIQVCLQKDTKQRVRDISAIRLAMEGGFEAAAAEPIGPVAVEALQIWQRRIPALFAALALFTAGGFAAWILAGSGPATLRVERFTIPPPAPEAVGVSNGRRDIAISPDGTYVVYAATGGNPSQLYVRQLDALAATPLRGLDTMVFGPFVSPDSAWVGYYDNTDQTLKKVSFLGGPSVLICRTGGGSMGASWGEDDTIIFGTSRPSGLWRVSADGGVPEELTTPAADQVQENHAWPFILPGGRAVLFTIMADAIETARIAVLELDSGEQRILFSGGSAPRYSPTGHIVYGVGGTLRAIGFDLDRLEVTSSNSVPVLDGVNTKDNGSVNFDLALDGSLVYVAGQDTSLGLERMLVWVDRDGNEEPLDLPTGSYRWPRLSPNGTRLAVTVQDQENVDVWIGDTTRGPLTKLTTEPGVDDMGLWTPDGNRVVFTSRRDGTLGLFWAAADGSEDVERLLTIDDARSIRAYAWSDGGKSLVFQYSTARSGADIGVLSMEGGRSWKPLIQTEANEEAPALSPDGQWIAYTSDEIGVRRVYVDRFPGLGGRNAVSRGAGDADPLWAPDGHELSYVRAQGRTLMVVPVELGTTLRIGEARELFEGLYFDGGADRDRDLSSDGRFLRVRLSGDTAEAVAEPQAILVKNWHRELLELVPIN